MNIREEINKVLDTLPEDSLEAVLEYARYIREPEEVEPTEGEMKAITRGKEEIARGEVVRWRDIRKNAI
ncbi:hypothetical protein [Desulfobacca acetoxidans]|uniref:DUF2281 domain-containing protein n=1 Tax=Desulfobacca acetoxidans (strain ATCC 700848 / DSM 11109 / ASRB2) TaxID=880072 RepID=F2NCW1_DESAR|nr:hypothetical protein [Desulfobacca acetoxidans]AEB09535.1 hypothetical protein Desac_1689 [Desulfobacca acetoxidans DSM 11109]